MFVNLTPHEIRVFDENDNEVVVVPPSGAVARVAVSYVHTGTIDDVPIYHATYGEVEGLPEPTANTFYIVSGLVKAAVPDRLDVLAPGDLIRDENGRPVGCRGLKI